ncbi:MAG: hypothetical protein AAFR26_24855 [Cyanobacteria bacterium J06626_4]
MNYFSRSLALFQYPVMPLATIGLIATSAFSLMTSPAQAQATDFDYDNCASELLDAGIAPDAAAAACAMSYRPTEISSCVSGVLNASAVLPESALVACSRDRRPDEVATCVSNIHADLVVNDSEMVLEHCHRTILPERYAACVVGIANEVDYTTEDSLTTCIAAGYKPLDIEPSYIPLD